MAYRSNNSRYNRQFAPWRATSRQYRYRRYR